MAATYKILADRPTPDGSVVTVAIETQFGKPMVFEVPVPRSSIAGGIDPAAFATLYCQMRDAKLDTTILTSIKVPG